MFKDLFYNRKLVISIFAVLIVLATAVALGPLFYSLYMGAGVKTEGIDAEGAEPASAELDGDWQVVQGSGRNFTSAGFTFHEILPAEEKVTSGSTTAVSGHARISGNVMDQASITVNLENLTSDKQVRDQNTKDKLLEVEFYPEAYFELTKPVDLAAVPGDGSVGTVTMTGGLTIKDNTNSITQDFDVLRTGDQIVVAGDIPINRLDYGVETPEFIAAKIDEEGFVNVRVTLEK
ncbi:YceI family protein [Corynebacterium endometrii]|uniref:YceI-like domain protein n=1 Tax=Corynebacterium endometrii TaxID=2488819 RepID=A0A4V1CEK4_9CORY|nr:YceI family protein [Corynebacterium endometrii]QCB28418.1 YceI-like domain protein [Corynebacterium endometrii]